MRHFSPFFSLPIPGSGTCFVVGQAFEPDIPSVGLESPNYSNGGAVAPTTAR
jgi:hypothetical protein